MLEHLDRAVQLGIQHTPAIIIDDQLVHQGDISNRRLQQLLAANSCLQ